MYNRAVGCFDSLLVSPVFKAQDHMFCYLVIESLAILTTWSVCALAISVGYGLAYRHSRNENEAVLTGGRLRLCTHRCRFLQLYLIYTQALWLRMKVQLLALSLCCATFSCGRCSTWLIGLNEVIASARYIQDSRLLCSSLPFPTLVVIQVCRILSVFSVVEIKPGRCKASYICCATERLFHSTKVQKQC